MSSCGLPFREEDVFRKCEEEGRGGGSEMLPAKFLHSMGVSAAEKANKVVQSSNKVHACETCEWQRAFREKFELPNRWSIIFN